MICDPPDINPNGVYSVGEACKLLQICRATLAKACQMSVKCGGIRYTIRPNGRKAFNGADLLRFWRGTL